MFTLRHTGGRQTKHAGFIPEKVPNSPQDLTMLEARLNGQVADA